MNNCSNIHFFYDKYAGDHIFSNSITSRISLHELINLDNFIIYNNEDANIFYRNKFKDNILCELDRELFCSHIYVTKTGNNNIIDKNYIIPSIYTVIGINIVKLKKCINDSNIPNINFLKNLFYFHYNYEKNSKYIVHNLQSFELNILSISRLFKIIYFFINHDKKKLNELANILYINNNDHLIQIDDIYYDVNKNIFLLENNKNINFDLLFLNLSCNNSNTTKKNKFCLNKMIDVILLLLKLQQKIIFISSGNFLEDYLHLFNINLSCKVHIIKTYLQFTQYLLKKIDFEHIIIISDSIFDILYEKNITKKTKNNIQNIYTELLKEYIILICDDIYYKYDIICNVFNNKKILIYSNNNKYFEDKHNNEIICIYNFIDYSYSICYQKNKLENKFTENEYFPINKYLNINLISIIKCNIYYKKKNIHYYNVKMTQNEQLIYWLFIDNNKYDIFFSIPFYYYIKKFLVSNDILINLNIHDKQFKITIHNKLLSDLNILCSKHDFDMLFSIFNNIQLNCCICLNFILNNIGITRCHHYFCYECIILYLQENDNCPCCRTNLKNKNYNRNMCTHYPYNIYKYDLYNSNNMNNKITKTYIGTKLLHIIKYILSIYNINIQIILLSSWNIVIKNLYNIFNKTININSEIYSQNNREHKNIIFTTSNLSDIDFNCILQRYKKIYVVFLDQQIYKNNKYFVNKSSLFNKKIHFVNFIVENTFDEHLFGNY